MDGAVEHGQVNVFSGTNEAVQAREVSAKRSECQGGSPPVQPSGAQFYVSNKS